MSERIILVASGAQAALLPGRDSDLNLLHGLNSDGRRQARDFAQHNEALLRRCTFFSTGVVLVEQETLFEVMGGLGAGINDYNRVIYSVALSVPESCSHLCAAVPVQQTVNNGRSVLWSHGRNAFRDGVVTDILAVMTRTNQHVALCVSHGKIIDACYNYVRSLLDSAASPPFVHEPFGHLEGFVLQFGRGMLISLEELRTPAPEPAPTA